MEKIFKETILISTKHISDTSLVHPYQKDFTKELAISSGRIPPNAVEFEKLVLGTCLIDSKGLKETIKKFNLKDLKSECFSSEVGYYMNAKDILWVTWIRHKKIMQRDSLIILKL